MLFKSAVSLAFITLLLSTSPLTAAPTTVVEVNEKLDLETLPLPKGAEMAGYRRAAELSYTVKTTTKKAFDFVDRQLADRGWKQVPGAVDRGGFVSADYQLDGYGVHLSTIPQGLFTAQIMLSHKGNVALVDIPVPTNVEKMYAFPGVVMYKSPDSVEATAKACHEGMLAADWSPYGGAGQTAYYRQNAMQIEVNVMSAPGQGGATVISITSKLLSLELPAPPFADDFRYSDGTTVLSFDTDKTPQEVADFYRKQLAPVGWKATTDKPVAIDWKQFTIFRNAGQEMITIETHEFEGQTRVKLDHQNALSVADDDLRGNIAFGEKAKYSDKKWLEVEVAIPSGLKVKQLEDWALKIPTPKENAFATAETIIKSLVVAGWTSETKEVDDPVIRSYRLAKQDQRIITLIAIEPPKREPWVAVVGIGGVKLEPVE